MEDTATPTRVGPATTTPGVATGSTTGQSVQLISVMDVMIVVLVDPRELRPLEELPTPPTTTTTRVPAPPTTREGSNDAQQWFCSDQF